MNLPSMDPYLELQMRRYGLLLLQRMIAEAGGNLTVGEILDRVNALPIDDPAAVAGIMAVSGLVSRDRPLMRWPQHSAPISEPN